MHQGRSSASSLRDLVGLSLPPSEKWSGSSPRLLLSADKQSAASENLRHKLSLSAFATAASHGPSKPLKPLETSCIASEPHHLGSPRRTAYAVDDSGGGRKNADECSVKSAGRSWILHEKKPAMHDYAPLGSFKSKSLSSVQLRRQCSAKARISDGDGSTGSSKSSLGTSPVLVDDEPLPFYRPARPADAKRLSTSPVMADDEPLPFFRPARPADAKRLSASPVLADDEPLPFYRPARPANAKGLSTSPVDDEPLPFYRPARPADAATLKAGAHLPICALPAAVAAAAPASAHLAGAVESQSADEPPTQLNNNAPAGKADHHPQAFLSKYEIIKSYIATGSTCYVMEVKLRPARGGVDRALDGISSEAEGNKEPVESSPLFFDKSNQSPGDDSDERYACKVITIRKKGNASMSESREDVLNELDVLKQLSSHRRILQLRDVFWSDCGDMCYMITSLAKGGDLHEKVWRGGPSLDEKAAKAAMQQVLEGVAFMHGKGFVHRDLKLSNIVITTVGSKGSETSATPVEFQIADFGMSKHLSQDDGSQGKHTICGSPSCVAPEILECPHVCQWSGKKQAQYGKKIDVWSCGVMLFTMLAGKEPFTGKGIGDLFRSIRIGEIDLTGPTWAKISEEAKDFVRLLLTTNPAERPTAEEALAHAWIATDAHLSPSQ